MLFSALSFTQIEAADERDQPHYIDFEQESTKNCTQLCKYTLILL